MAMSRRRAHGAGSIRRRGERSWELRYELARDVDRKRQRVTETVHGNRRDAEVALRERVTAVETGNFLARSQETVNQFLTRWLETYAASNVSVSTARGYSSKLDTYVRPAFGDVQLQQLRPDPIQRLYGEMLGRGLMERTVLHTHRILRQALAAAVKWGDLARNPADAVSPPTPKQRQMDMWTKEDAIRFFEIVKGHRYADLYRILLLTGLRRSEAAGLKWSSVDLDSSSLQVVSTLQPVVGHGLIEGQPKTPKSRRAVALSLETVAIFHAIRGQQKLDEARPGNAWHNEAGRVFTQPCGCPVNPDAATKEFTLLVREARLPKITLHGLRHAHATLMLSENVHPLVVSQRLGHSSVAVTLDVYSHVLPTLQAEAAAQLGATLVKGEESK